MNSATEKLTRLHLQAFGLSDYVVNQLFKDLKPVSLNGGLKEYGASDVRISVEKRLSNPKVQSENRSKLKRTLVWLKGESNVIPVDFLKGLSPIQKVEVLRDRIQEMEVQEQALAEETEKLVLQARQMVASK
jgi:hypothetical protein